MRNRALPIMREPSTASFSESFTTKVRLTLLTVSVTRSPTLTPLFSSRE